MLPLVFSSAFHQIYSIVHWCGYSFTLVDANTVRHLATTDKSLLPYKVLDAAKDIPWNTKKINAEVLQGILQGDSINKISDRLMNVQEMNKTQAVRSARTIVTSAECKGRQDSYEKAKQDGMIIKKYWLATYDARARDWHREAGARYTPENGIDPDDFFIVDGEKMLYPGDGSHGASGHNLYNCRCSVASKVVGFRKVSVAEQEETLENSAAEDIIEFKKADTIEDARKYASEILGIDQTIAYSLGMNVDVANGLNKAVFDISNKFGSLTEYGYLENVLLYTKKSGAYASYSEPLRVVYLNPVVKLKSAIKTMAKTAADQYSLGAWATPNAMHTVYHELGHAVQHMILDSDREKRSKIDALFAEAYSSVIGDGGEWKEDGIEALNMAKKAKKAGFSYYGLKSADEMVAESIAQYFLSGNSCDIAKKVIEILTR